MKSADPASQPDHESEVTPEVRAVSFHHKPWWQRLLVVLAGPVANFLLATAISAAFFMAYPIPNTPAVATAVARGSAAERAGLQGMRRNFRAPLGHGTTPRPSDPK